MKTITIILGWKKYDLPFAWWSIVFVKLKTVFIVCFNANFFFHLFNDLFLAWIVILYGHLFLQDLTGAYLLWDAWFLIAWQEKVLDVLWSVCATILYVSIENARYLFKNQNICLVSFSYKICYKSDDTNFLQINLLSCNKLHLVLPKYENFIFLYIPKGNFTAFLN